MVELHAQISSATNKKLKRAQSLLASKGKATNLDGVLNVCLDLYLDHHDPVRKAKRAEARAAQRTEHGTKRSEERITRCSSAKTTKTKQKTKEVRSEQFAQHCMPATAKPEAKTEQAKLELSNPAASTEYLAEHLTAASISLSNANNVIVESTDEAIAADASLHPQEFCVNRTTDTAYAANAGPDLKSSDTPVTLRHPFLDHRTPRRKTIKAATHHAVILRTGGRCAFVNQRGERCNEDRFLHLHHIVPLSQGGSDDPSNLTCLCSGHHALVHQLSLGIEGQGTWLRSPQVAYDA
jgi:hypothetical protein